MRDLSAGLSAGQVRSSRALRALLTERCGEPARWPELAVDGRDEMFEVACHVHLGDLDAALVEYFRVGEQVASLVLRVGTGLLGDERPWSLLDFGSGYGRVTRFFARRLGPSRVIASDILDGTSAFLEQRLGVSAFRSSARAEELTPARDAFDLIYAGSLFTHLPREPFERWLERLLALSVDSGGVLLLTVHDHRLLPPEVEADPSGLTFVEESESRTLDKQSYGSTWVTTGFLARCLRNRAGSGSELAWKLLPRAVGHYQDLLVVVAARHAAALDRVAVRGGPDGFVERCDLRDVASFEISGWISSNPERGEAGEAQGKAGNAQSKAGTARSGPPCVELWSDGRRLASADYLLPRSPGSQDAAPVLDWRLRLDLGAPAAYSEVVVTIKALDALGERILYVGSLERLLFVCAAENYRRHYQRTFELASIILAMKSSRFWRLRKRWLRLKRALGFATEDPDEPRVQERDLEPPRLESVRPRR